MSEESTDRQRYDLISDILGAKAEGARIEALGREISRQGRFVQDLADATERIFVEAPVEYVPASGWEAQRASWQSLRGSLAQFRPNFRTIAITSMGTTNSTMSGFLAIGSSSTSHSPRFEDAKAQLLKLRSRQDIATQLRADMRRLKLDIGVGGRRSALDLLNEAESALDRPVLGDGRATSTLLPLRGCVEAAFEALIRRRPTQQPAKNWGQKLLSISQQCSYPNVAADVFERLADDANRLNDDLSEAKMSVLSRSLLSDQFYRGLHFLTAMLSGIDDSRLKSI